MGRAVVNWIDEAGLERLRKKGWSVRSRREIPEEGRILLELYNSSTQVGEQSDVAAVTYRSLPL